jgi:mRNA interferase RelE/StbE
MRFEDTKDFRKVLKRLPIDVQKSVIEAIENIDTALTFSDIHDFKPLKGHSNYYRIRIRTYRMGLFWDGEKFILESVGTRGDFYKTYP